MEWGLSLVWEWDRWAMVECHQQWGETDQWEHSRNSCDVHMSFFIHDHTKIVSRFTYLMMFPLFLVHSHCMAKL